MSIKTFSPLIIMQKFQMTIFKLNKWIEKKKELIYKKLTGLKIFKPPSKNKFEPQHTYMYILHEIALRGSMTTSSQSKCVILRPPLNWGSQIYTLMSDLTWIGYGAFPFCMPAIIQDDHFLFFDFFNSANAPNSIFINCFCFSAY